MINILIIATYFISMLAIGFMSSRRIRNISSFYVSDRSGSTLLISGSLLATIVGASQTLGLAGLGYTKGLVGAWWMLVGSLGLFTLTFWLAGKVRETEVYTLPELLKRQYGSETLKIIASLLISIAWLGVIAAQIVAAGKIMTTLWPLHMSMSVIMMGVVFILYTTLGGQYSVLKTDFIQFIIILAGVVACMILSVNQAGGISALMQNLPASHFSFPVSDQFSWHDLLLFILFVGSVYLVGPDMYSRILSARSPSTAKRATFLSALVMVPLAFVITMIGVSARAIFPGISAENAFPYVVMHVLPEGVNGFVVAALLAAVMSTAATCLLTTSTIVVSDVLRPLLNERFTEKKMLLCSRVAVIIIGCLSIFIALQAKGIISSLLLAYTVYSGGLVIPVIFGFYSRRLSLHSLGAIASVLVGGFLALYLKLTSHEDILVICFPLCILILFAGSWIGKRIGSKRAAG
jgi:solute:Na+ symporter, SSS family